MDRINKKIISGITLASILVAGTIVFTPQNATADLTALDKFGTIINLLIDIQNTVNNIFNEVTDGEHGLAEIKREVRNIEGNVTQIKEDLRDKLKLIVGNHTDDVEAQQDETFLITINATNIAGELVIFNLKELYVCGEVELDAATGGQLAVREAIIEDGDIVIGNFGGVVGIIDGDSTGESCADVLSLFAAIGRAGAAGLGSESNIVIKLDMFFEGTGSGTITLVKCIAFVPQEAETLTCDVTIEE